MCITAIICFIFYCTTAADVDIVRQAPSLDGYDYHCSDMIHTVNAMRAIGKGRALNAMREYLALKGEPGQQRIVLICLLLFADTNRVLHMTALGDPSPKLDLEIADKYPVFPLVIHDGVPFLAVQGYMLGGLINLHRVLNECERLDIIKRDIENGDPTRAAKRLIKEPQWRRLFLNSDDWEDMNNIVIAQATSNKG